MRIKAASAALVLALGLTASIVLVAPVRQEARAGVAGALALVAVIITLAVLRGGDS